MRIVQMQKSRRGVPLCLLALVLLLCGLFLLPNAEAIGVSERAEQQRQRRLREGPSGKTKASSPSDETPAEETHDDETFDRQEKQATDLVANHEKMVEEAKACVKNEETKAKIAEATFQKLLRAKDELRASRAKLADLTEKKREAQDQLVSKMDEWSSGIANDSAERIAIMKRSSEDLLKKIREKKGGGEGQDERLTGIEDPPGATIDVSVSSAVTALLETAESVGDDAPSSNKDSSSSLEAVYEGLHNMLKEYATANDLLPESVANKLARLSEERTDAAHENLRNLTLDHIDLTEKNIEEAMNAQMNAKKSSEKAAETCHRNLANMGPTLAAAQEAAAITRKKREASDAYYAEQVLHFKEAVTFAESALKGVEALAEREFAGRADALQSLREEIARTLDLCSKLEGSEGPAEGSDESDVLHRVTVRHALTKTVAQASAQTESHEVVASKTTRAST